MSETSRNAWPPLRHAAPWLALAFGLGAVSGAQAADTASLRALQAQQAYSSQPGEPLQGEHVGKKGLHPSQLPLRNADSLVPPLQRENHKPETSSARRRSLAVKTLASGTTVCTGNDFVGKSGSTLLGFIDNASLRDCMYKLYIGSAAQYRTVFSDANIITVSDELKRRALSYNGTDSNKAMNLLSFLRTAGYWNYMSVRGDSWNGIPAGSTAMLNSARGALTQLMSAPAFMNQTEDNAYFASEVFKTAASGFAASMAPVAKRWIDQTQASTFATGYWTNETILAAMNVLFYGDGQDDYAAAVANDASYARSLDAFLTRNRAQAGTSYGYHLANAMGEMLRFLRYPALTSTVRPLGVNQLSTYKASDDATIDAWMRAGTMVDKYDSANCGSYGTCNAYDTVARIKLPITYACGTQYVIRAQAMTSQQLVDTCTSISNQTGYFHGLFGTNASQPVANDTNAKLELVVFDSYAQYSRFSGFLFGNDTNNGGIYLEGDPSQPGNQARFLAHRADWLAGFEIWNLNHEFTHYLDGRYNLWGGFGAYPLELNGTVKNSSVWWIEGVAEYVSYSYRRAYNADATSRAQTAPVALSEVMRNTYSSGQTRVYNWGYLAVRYMLERQPSQDQAFLPLMRKGDYAGYSNRIDAIGTSLDADFKSWLTQCIGNGDLASSNCTSRRANTLPLLNADAIGACNLSSTSVLANGCSRALSGTGPFSFSMNANSWELAIFRLSNLKGGADVYAKATGWPSTTDYDFKVGGSNTDLRLPLQTRGAGYVYVMVVPRSDFVSANLRGMFSDLPLQPATPDWSQGPVCTDTSSYALNTNGCVRNGLTSNGSNPGWYAVLVPTGKSAITVKTTGGTGNADVYLKHNAWPSTSDYGCRSVASGNTETCRLSGLPSGTWVYVMLTPGYGNLSIAATAD